MRVYATNHALPAGTLMSLCWAQLSPVAMVGHLQSLCGTQLRLSLFYLTFVLLQALTVLRLLGRLPPRRWPCLCQPVLLQPVVLIVKRQPTVRAPMLAVLALNGLPLVSPLTALTLRIPWLGI